MLSHTPIDVFSSREASVYASQPDIDALKQMRSCYEKGKSREVEAILRKNAHHLLDDPYASSRSVGRSSSLLLRLIFASIVVVVVVVVVVLVLLLMVVVVGVFFLAICKRASHLGEKPIIASDRIVVSG